MIFTQAVVLGLAALAAAHPGHEHEEISQAIKARDATRSNKRALENCAAKLAQRGVSSRAAERRSATLASQRKAKRIDMKGKSTR